MLGQHGQLVRGEEVHKISIHHLDLVSLLLAIHIIGDNQLTGQSF